MLKSTKLEIRTLMHYNLVMIPKDRLLEKLLQTNNLFNLSGKVIITIIRKLHINQTKVIGGVNFLLVHQLLKIILKFPGTQLIASNVT